MKQVQEEHLCRDIHKIARALEKIAKALPSAEQEAHDINVGNMDAISRQQAIDALDKRFSNVSMEQTTEILMLRKDLRELPSIQPEMNSSEIPNNSDTISRQQAIDVLKAIQTYKLFAGDDMLLIDQAEAQTELMMLPSAKPTIEPKSKGEWVYGEHDAAMCDGYRCNHCGFFVPWDYKYTFIDFIKDYHFCPNCGAKMKGERKE